MDFWTAVRLMGRRWRVWVLGIVLTVLAATAVVLVVQPKYVASADILLLVPTEQTSLTGTDQVVNPYLNFSSGLATTAEVLVQALNGDEAIEAVREQGGQGKYTAQAFQGSAPIVTLTVEGRDPQSPLSTLRIYTEQLKRGALGPPGVGRRSSESGDRALFASCPAAGRGRPGQPHPCCRSDPRYWCDPVHLRRVLRGQLAVGASQDACEERSQGAGRRWAIASADGAHRAGKRLGRLRRRRRRVGHAFSEPGTDSQPPL